jgi:putative transcriptional regulator
MTKGAFTKIEEGLKEALDIARGKTKPARLFVPPELDVKSIREKTRLSQDAFASTFGFTVHQIRQWEQSRCRPLGAIRAYLMLIDKDPKAIISMLSQASRLEAA